MNSDLNQENLCAPGCVSYRNTLGVAGTVRRPDRMLAEKLYRRGMSVQTVENALVLASTRRLMQTDDAPPLGTVRSLAYFVPVIDEVLQEDLARTVPSGANTTESSGTSLTTSALAPMVTRLPIRMGPMTLAPA